MNKISKELDLTPPSFYFFPKEEITYIETINEAKLIMHPNRHYDFNVFLKEEKENDMFSRIIFIKRTPNLTLV